MEDLRYAFRALWKDPGFTIPAAFALALSIGANSSVFTIVKSVLLNPLPMQRPEQLMAVYQVRPDGQKFPFNIPVLSGPARSQPRLSGYVRPGILECKPDRRSEPRTLAGRTCDRQLLHDAGCG